MRRRQLQDSQTAFHVCIIMMLLIIVLSVLFNLAADAIDQGMKDDAAALDQQLSPAQRAEIIGRLQ